MLFLRILVPAFLTILILSSATNPLLSTSDWYYEMEEGSIKLKFPPPINTSTPFLAYRVQINNELLLVQEPYDSQSGGNIIFIDISNPHNLRKIGKLEGDPIKEEGINTFYSMGEMLFTSVGNPTTLSPSILKIYDVGDTSKPRLVYNHK
ncbi:MAG: hypothetical protein NDF54_08910, partial [archaeon GB-1867-035]|nr:hypothetical protein [Candidatus Culexmicrobium profundum]